MTGSGFRSFFRNMYNRIPIKKRPTVGYTSSLIAIGLAFDKHFNNKGTESNEDPESVKLYKEIESEKLSADKIEYFKKYLAEDLSRNYLSTEQIRNLQKQEVHNSYLATRKNGHLYLKRIEILLTGNAHLNAMKLTPKELSILLLKAMPLGTLLITKEQFETLYKSFQRGNKEYQNELSKIKDSLIPAEKAEYAVLGNGNIISISSISEQTTKEGTKVAIMVRTTMNPHALEGQVIALNLYKPINEDSGLIKTIHFGLGSHPVPGADAMNIATASPLWSINKSIFVSILENNSIEDIQRTIRGEDIIAIQKGVEAWKLKASKEDLNYLTYLKWLVYLDDMSPYVQRLRYTILYLTNKNSPSEKLDEKEPDPEIQVAASEAIADVEENSFENVGKFMNQAEIGQCVIEIAESYPSAIETKLREDFNLPNDSAAGSIPDRLETEENPAQALRAQTSTKEDLPKENEINREGAGGPPLFKPEGL